MAGCNWCGTTEVKLAENKPYCPDCASNCKRECTVCHKPYPNLKFYEKHSKRCNSCQSRYIVAKTKKASMEIIAENLVIQQENENNMTKRQLTVMETLQINKMKQDKEAGDKKKKRKCGKNTAEVTAEKSQILQQVAEFVSKKHGRGQLIVNF